MTINRSFTILLLSGLLLLDGKAANDPTPSPVMVSKVTFSNGTLLRNDDGSAMSSTHWIDEKSNTNPNETQPFPDGRPDPDPPKPKPNDVKSYAYSYHATTRPMVQAEFKWKNPPPSEGSPYWADGQVVNTTNCTFKLPMRKLVGNTIYPESMADQNIVNDPRIQAYVTENRKVVRSDETTDSAANLVPVTIEWTVYDTFNKPVGTSRSTHTIYVTWNKPSFALNKETLFNLSCVMANGMASDTLSEKIAITDKIFAEFKDLKIRRMDDSVLNYYKEINANISASELLFHGDGQCGSFVELLCHSLSCGGVVATPIRVTPVFVGIEPRLLVKNWTFNQGTLPTPWTHRFDPDKPEKSEVTSLPAGVKGQGDINPIVKRFRLHYLVHQSGRYFDPSYGKLAPPAAGTTAQISWENISLDGYDVTGTYPISDNPLTFEDDINVARPEEPDDFGTIFTLDHL